MGNCRIAYFVADYFISWCHLMGHLDENPAVKYGIGEHSPGEKQAKDSLRRTRHNAEID